MLRRALHVVLIAVFALTVLGVSDNNSRYEKLGHEMVCQCGCGQILLECNHVGCPVSGPMQQELHQQLDAGLNNKNVLAFFINKYGPIVLAAPIRGGFDLVAWIIPIVVTAVCLGLVVYLIGHWKRRSDLAHAGASSEAPPDYAIAPENSSNPVTSLQSRIRRETDYDQWNETGSVDVDNSTDAGSNKTGGRQP